MDVVLIQPVYSKVYGFKKDISSVLPPLNLMYLSAYLEQYGYKTKIIDLEVDSFSELEQILKNSGCKIFGIGGVTSIFPEVKTISHLIKSHNKDNKIIFGGPHATAVKDSIFQICDDIDIVVIGEGEETLKEIVDHYSTNNPKQLAKIKGIIYRESSGKICNTSPRKLISNIDSICLPNHNAINYNLYHPSLHRDLGNPFAVLIGSRGCPFHCNYCGTQTIFGSTVRYRSIKNIITEIDFLVKRFGIKNLIFWDDTFCLNKSRVVDLCKLLKKYNLNWSCNTRLDTVNYNLLCKMRAAGCKIIFYGVESSNETILKKLGHDVQLKQIEVAIRDTKRANIRATASMMIGTPFDTPEQVEKNITYMIRLNPDFAFFSPFAPHPGTPIYNYCVSKRIIENWKGWQNQVFEDVPLNHPTANLNLDRKTIQNYLQQAYRQFYSRPSYYENKSKEFVENWEIKIFNDLKEKFGG